MKKLMFATALVASAAAFATNGTALNAISFEGYGVGYRPGATNSVGVAELDETGTTKGLAYFWYDGESDGSEVKALEGEGNAPTPGITRPYYFQGETPAKYLDLSTEGGTLWRSINDVGNSPTGLGTAQAVAADGTYLDTLVQFTATEDGGSPELGAEDKLAIWLNVDSTATPSVTNLMVRAGSYDDQGTLVTNQTFVLTGTGVTIEPGVWYRLTVKAVDNVLPSAEVYKIPGFRVFINGTEMAATTSPFDATFVAGLREAEQLDADQATELASGKVLPSLLAGDSSATSTLQGVGFKGSGWLDDIVWTEENPFQAPAGIDFSLTWPAGLTAVSYSINGGEAVAISGSSPFAVPGLAADDVVTFIVANADGAQKTLTGTAGTDEGIDATGTTFGWPEYLGAAVDGAYEIDNLAELKLFQKGVAFTTNELKLATAGETFKLTADIALDAAWPGIGVQNGKDIYSTEGFNAAAFQGTFDGQNHTISGFQMVGRDGNLANVGKAESAWEGADYCGFFNSTYGATIQNLKIAYAGGLFAADTASGTKESGATFVGVAKNSTLRNLTTVAGTVSCSKGFGGIVGYLTSGTTVDSCTNNVNMTSLAGNKCGGIAMIAQGGSAVTISNCQNNGTQTTSSGNSEYGAIVGYVGLDVTIADCETTVGRFLKHQGNTVTLQGVNKGDPTVPAYHGAATPGLNFATVDGSTATFVADTAITTGNTYKVLGPSATATYEFAAAGSISFDTNLIQAVTFAITAAQGLDAPTETTENGVVTFTVAAQGGDDYVVEIEGSDVVITPSAEDLAAVQAAVVAGGGTLDVTDVAAVNAAMAAPIGTTGIPSWQALFLGLPPTEAGLESFKIDSISIGPDGNVTVALPAGVEPMTGRGVTITLKLKAADTPNAAPADWTDVESASGTTFAPFAPGSTDTKKFYKVVVDFAATPAQN